MKRPLILAGALASATAFAACSGGSTSTFSPPPPSTGTVAFSITVPNAPASSTSTASRRPNFNAPSGAQSVAISLMSSNGSSSTQSSPTVANLSSTTPGCTSGTSGLTCTVNVSAPSGNDVFTVTTYDQPNAKGNTLGAGTVTVAATPGQTTTAPTTLSGTVASVAVSVAAVVPEGVPTSVPVILAAKDSNGNTIIGAYSSPVTLALTDASNHTKLSATSVPDSTTAASLMLTYDGGAMNTAATIAPSVTGLAASALTSGSFKPNGSYPTVNGTTVSWVHVYQTANGPGPSPTYGPTSSPLPYTATLQTGVSYNGVNNLIGLTSAYQNGASGTDYYAWSTGASSNTLQYVGSKGTVLANNVLSPDSTTCNAPYQTLLTIPFSAVANTRANIGSCTFTFTLPSGSTTESETSTTNADGSYTQTFSWNATSRGGFSFGATTNQTVNSDGSGTQWFSGTGGVDSYSIALATPAPGATSIPAWYTVVSSSPLPSPVPTAPARSSWNQSVPNWLPLAGITSGVFSSPLATDTLTPKGSATLPSACAVPSSVLGASPSIIELDETYTWLDPFVGSGTTVDRYFYLNGVGLVCTAFNIKAYYEYETDPTVTAPYGDDVFLEQAYNYVTSSTLTAAAQALHTSDARAAASFAGQFLAMASRAENNPMMLRQQMIMRRMQARTVR